MRTNATLVFGLACAVLLPTAVLAQTQPAPAVQWRSITWLDEKPPYGTNYTLTGIDHDPEYPNNITGVHYSQAPCTGGAVTQDESSEDWWYAHVNIYDANHVLIGYAAAGYSHIPMWGADFGCKQYGLDGISPEYLDTWEHRRGTPFATVGLFDLNGHMIWCSEGFMPGTFYGLTQATDGSIVCIGEAIG